MTDQFKYELEQVLAESKSAKQIVRLNPVSGGSINDAYQIQTESQNFFLKVNSADQFPNMFDGEKNGLNLLSRAHIFQIPKPLFVRRIDDKQILLMEWIEQGTPKPDFWEQFGRGLAELHGISADKFGLDQSNFIGSLSQSNNWKTTWAEFYREERLRPQMELAARAGQLSSKMKLGFNGLFKRLDGLFPKEPPSLLHGDLWSGNMMVSASGKPCIFDPAVYFGHREMDLAMMALFGGFGNAWVDAYNEIYPLENSWKGRIPLGQLYPLMVHVNLFGGSYARSVESILQKFI